MAMESSRYGSVIRVTEPVMMSYDRPVERVLLSKYRDANPFFHFFEALWVLAGRNDIEPLKWFNSRVAEFSDDGKTWWGAYGARWRDPYLSDTDQPYPKNERKLSQVDYAIRILRRDRSTRRVVLEQWMPYDLHRVWEMPDCKDVPCNTEVMFMPRLEYLPGATHESETMVATTEQETLEFLDMTVINRSNDMIWGAMGSNFVTFSMLHEYVASAAGYRIGHYHQISNNLHVYASEEVEAKREVAGVPVADSKMLWSDKWEPAKFLAEDPRRYPGTIPMIDVDLSGFDTDLRNLFSRPMHSPWTHFHTTFFDHTVKKMLLAFNCYKQKNYHVALAHCLEIGAPDWQVAAIQWIEKRAKAASERHAQQQSADT
jgi:thymidylate synthase